MPITKSEILNYPLTQSYKVRWITKKTGNAEKLEVFCAPRIINSCGFLAAILLGGKK